MFLIHSTPYNAQSNGQVEAVNKQLKKEIQNAIENNPRDWHNILLDVLWAYRTSKRSSTGTTPYTLVYGHDAVLPVKIGVKSLRMKNQNDLTGCQYQQAMNMELENIDEQRIRALNSIQLQKKRAAKCYNKRVQHRTFDEGDLVWKTILPIGLKDPRFGKWSPNWGGPF